MTRKEFEDAIRPLNSNEQFCKENKGDISKLPSLRNIKNIGDLSESRSRISNNHLIFNPELDKSINNIFPDVPVLNFSSPDIAFNRHDRFSNVPLHGHDFIEMNYLFSGHATVVIDGEENQLKEGDFCILSTDVLHKISPTGEEDIMLNILVAQNYFHRVFMETFTKDNILSRYVGESILQANHRNSYLIFHTARSQKVKELIEDMFIEYLEPGPCCGDMLRLSLNLLFIELGRCYQGHMERKAKKENKYYLTEILRYIDENCTTCTLEEVAEKFNYHPNYLSRLLKMKTGYSFQKIIRESRMKRVTFLLKYTKEPIYQIAVACGYQNQSFFHKQFEKLYGCSPKKYREVN